ncbi:MAG TPA: ATP-binding protein [Actinomycetota bacterium]|jgi:anti-sigma regulatory factor (Ser/Thr protein kinase)|nr:ATP-binding protein [Actinomycetota bacterium]
MAIFPRETNVSESVVMLVDPNPEAVGLARDGIDRFRGRLAERTIEDARLLVSELVTNSLRHAGLRPDQQIEIALDLDQQRFRVEVVDPGRGFELRPRAAGTPAGAGWGLSLVAQLASRWGASSDGVTNVWFEIELPRSHRPSDLR